MPPVSKTANLTLSALGIKRAPWIAVVLLALTACESENAPPVVLDAPPAATPGATDPEAPNEAQESDDGAPSAGDPDAVGDEPEPGPVGGAHGELDGEDPDPPAAQTPGRRQGPARRIFIRDAEARGAVCNDGSPAAYYARPGVGADRDRWIIFLEGGGGCSTPEECVRRWNPNNTDRMSSRTYPETLALADGLFSDDPTLNPRFRTWTHVFVRYCSSDYYVGNRADRQPACVGGQCPRAPYPADGWYFRGHRIITALLEDLADAPAGAPKLGDAAEVIWAGCSAGSLGAQRTLDAAAEFIQAQAVDREVPVAGLFDAAWRPRNPTREIDQVRATSGAALAMWDGVLDESCAAETDNDPLCLRSDFLEAHLQAPFFVFMDQVDSYILGDAPPATADQETWSFLAQQVRDELAPLPGVFCPQNNWHCATRATPRYYLEDEDGISLSRVFNNWYFELDGPTRYIDETPFPWE